MGNKFTYGLLGVFSVLVLAFGILAFSDGNRNLPSVSSSEDIDNEGVFCVSHVRDGEVLMSECSHNALYNSGANMTRDMLGDGGGAAVDYISLCNATANCTTPTASDDPADTDLYNEYTNCGLSEVQGTYNALGQTGNWTISTTFTATCNGLEVNATRLSNSTDEFAGNAFTLVTLQTNDQLTINVTEQVS